MLSINAVSIIDEFPIISELGWREKSEAENIESESVK